MLENKMTTYVKVPMDRVAVIIGPGGNTKALIEKKSTASLHIDSQTGSIEITDPTDPLLAMRAAEVIKSIGRGFSPDKVLRLFDDDMLTVEIMDLSFSIQTLCVTYILENKLSQGIYEVPKEVDDEVASRKLESMNIVIDKLTRDQKEYLNIMDD